jgi:electron transfer flavoprotein alpha subunit
MSPLKRIDPRRPVRITPAGLRRIVLGETGSGISGNLALSAGHRKQPKPLRLKVTPARWLMAIAHSDRGRLDEHARQAIAAAAILAGPDTGVIAVVIGELNEDLAPVGADRVAILSALDAGRFEPERELAAVNALIESYRPLHIFIPDNVSGDGDLGRRLIAASASAGAAHVVELDRERAGIGWSGTQALAHMPLPHIVLLELGAAATELPFVGAAEAIHESDLPKVSAIQTACRDLGIEEQDAASVALEESDFIVAAGAGVENIGTLQSLAGALGAAIGASRVAVDAGRFPRDKQIGATGKTVSASAYMAVGISGAVQHLQGIKDCRHVIAINRDAGAPIVKRADLTIIGDAEEVMQALLRRIEQARVQREIPGTP